METSNNVYYVYAHMKISDGSPFYIGKGKGYRAFSKYRSIWWKKTASKNGFDVLFLEKNLSEKDALDREVYWINKIGRITDGGTLVNMTDGGESLAGKKNPMYGKKHTKNSKDKISATRKRLGLSPWNKGKKIDNRRTGLIQPNSMIEKTGHLVLNLETGIFYSSVGEASTYGSIYNRRSLLRMLNGERRNKTNFIKINT